MWKKQIRAQRAAEQAQYLKDKADRLRRESKDGTIGFEDGSSSHSSSDDENAKKIRSISQNASNQEETSGKPHGHP